MDNSGAGGTERDREEEVVEEKREGEQGRVREGGRGKEEEG